MSIPVELEELEAPARALFSGLSGAGPACVRGAGPCRGGQLGCYFFWALAFRWASSASDPPTFMIAKASKDTPSLIAWAFSTSVSSGRVSGFF